MKNPEVALVGIWIATIIGLVFTIGQESWAIGLVGVFLSIGILCHENHKGLWWTIIGFLLGVTVAWWMNLLIRILQSILWWIFYVPIR